jgi:hypothetical protein
MKYEVILRFDDGDPCRDIYSVVGKHRDVSGHGFLQLSCEQPELIGSFLRVLVLFGGATQADLVLWIPQRFVVAVFGDIQDRKIGFLDS